MNVFIDLGNLFPGAIKEYPLDIKENCIIKNLNLENITFRLSNEKPNLKEIKKHYNFNSINEKVNLRAIIILNKLKKEYKKEIMVIINGINYHFKYSVIFPKIKINNLLYYKSNKFRSFNILLNDKQNFYKINFKNNSDKNLNIIFLINFPNNKKLCDIKLKYDNKVESNKEFNLELIVNNSKLKNKIIKFLLILSFSNLKIGIPNIVEFY